MKVSIVTVVYNNVDTIKNCLLSVKEQTYSDIEHIVIDGGSGDGTVEFLLQNQKHIAFFESSPDDGIYDAINKGISHATGSVVGLLHADDVFYNRHVITDIARFFNKSQEVNILIGNAEFISHANKEKVIRLYNSSIFRVWTMRFGFMPAHTATFMSKNIFEKYGLYDKKYISAGDFDFFIRLLFVHKLPCFFLDQVIVKMNIGGVSTSGISSYLRTTKEISQSLKQHNIWSNYLLILLRLPIKAINSLLFLVRKAK